MVKIKYGKGLGVAGAPAARAGRSVASFTAPTANVLIVDDLPSNLLVFKELISPYRMRVCTCGSGSEAVELVRECPFDIVLMDYMMPDMDGVETVRVVRGMDVEHCRKVPVVAVTAGALAGMQEMFLRSGFNDFLSKPIDVVKLDELLRTWISVRKQRAVKEGDAEAVTGQRVSGAVAERFDLTIDGVDVVLGISRIGGSLSGYLRLLKIFRRDAETGFAPPPSEPHEASMRSFITLMHTLKSALANIGAETLSQKAAVLEKAAREADMAVIRAELPVFREEFWSSMAKIDEFLLREHFECGQGGPPLAEVLTVLRDALQTRDVDAMDAALESLHGLRLDGKIGEAAAEIGDLILTAEFGRAEDAVAVLLREHC
jgi:CheY-like chemotaxis protein